MQAKWIFFCSSESECECSAKEGRSQDQSMLLVMFPSRHKKGTPVTLSQALHAVQTLLGMEYKTYFHLNYSVKLQASSKAQPHP